MIKIMKMGRRKQAQSLYDFLLQVMPELGDGNIQLLVRQKTISDPNASSLYSLWTDSGNRISERKYRRPPTMTESDVKKLEQGGMLEVQGKDLKITSRGEKVIMEMILNDDHSPLDKVSRSKPLIKTASKKSNFKNWYTRAK